MSSSASHCDSSGLPGSFGRLPNSAYTSPDYFERECRSVLSATWQFAGRASAIPKAGDRALSSVAGAPIFLVRQKTGDIAAFYNVCPHRGAKIVPEACGGTRPITCPYHAWSFDLEGRLLNRPHFHGADKHDRAETNDAEDRPSLWPIRAEVFFDWVFVNLDGKARPLMEVLQPWVDRMHGYDFSGCVFGGELSFDVPANWKLAHENFLDIVHKIAIHPELQKAAPLSTNVRYEWLCDDNCDHPPSGSRSPTDGRGRRPAGACGAFPKALGGTSGLSAHIYPNLQTYQILGWPADALQLHSAWRRTARSRPSASTSARSRDGGRVRSRPAKPCSTPGGT